MVRRWVWSPWSVVSDVIVGNPRQWNCNVYCQEDWICGDNSDIKCDCSSRYDYAIGTGRQWHLPALPANRELFISLIVPETWVAGWMAGRKVLGWTHQSPITPHTLFLFSITNMLRDRIRIYTLHLKLKKKMDHFQVPRCLDSGDTSYKNSSSEIPGISMSVFGLKNAQGYNWNIYIYIYNTFSKLIFQNNFIPNIRHKYFIKSKNGI